MSWGSSYQDGLNVLEAIRDFTSQSGQPATYIYGLVSVGGVSGNFSTINSFGGIGLYAGNKEKFLIGEQYQSGNWGATEKTDNAEPRLFDTGVRRYTGMDLDVSSAVGVLCTSDQTSF